MQKLAKLFSLAKERISKAVTATIYDLELFGRIPSEINANNGLNIPKKSCHIAHCFFISKSESTVSLTKKAL